MTEFHRIAIPPAEPDPGSSPRHSAFRRLAREEFWIVAKSYFAPIFGTVLVLKRLVRTVRRLDRTANGPTRTRSGRHASWLTPAE